MRISDWSSDVCSSDLMDRLLAVLENNLSNNTYVAGNEYSIADIAVWPFVHGLSVMGLDLATLPALSRWINRIGSRPMVRRALAREEIGRASCRERVCEYV